MRRPDHAPRPAGGHGLAGVEQGPRRSPAPGPGDPEPGEGGPRLVGPGNPNGTTERSDLMDLNTLYHRTVEHWADVVVAVRDDQWDSPTPCSEWSVRDLVNHVTGEDLWTAALVAGGTIEEVGTRPGRRPARRRAGREVDRRGEGGHHGRRRTPAARGGTVPLSFGDTDVAEYVLAAHGRPPHPLLGPLGRDGDRPAPRPRAGGGCHGWFAEREEIYRTSGERWDSGPSRTAGPGWDLLATFGRDSQWGPNHACAARFLRAFGNGDVDACLARDDARLRLRGHRARTRRRPPRGRGWHWRHSGTDVRRHHGSGVHDRGAVRRRRPGARSAGPTPGPARTANPATIPAALMSSASGTGASARSFSYVKG